MEEQIITIKSEHVHYFIQKQIFSIANILLEPLLHKFPKDPIFYQYRIVIASLNHNIESLLISYKQILENFPGTALELLAKGLYPGEKISNVKTSLHRAVKLDPKNPYLYYFLSSTYLHDGDYPTSLKYANKCLNLDSHFHLALYLRAACSSQLNMYEEYLVDQFSLQCYIPNYSSYRFFESLLEDWEKYKNSGKKPNLPIYFFPEIN